MQDVPISFFWLPMLCPLPAEVKARAADTLDKVLFELSSNMKNAYSRSDM